MLGWKIPLMLLIWSVIVIERTGYLSLRIFIHLRTFPMPCSGMGRHGFSCGNGGQQALLVWIYYAAAWIDGHSFAGIFLIQCVTLTTLLLACGTARFYLYYSAAACWLPMLLCLFLFDSVSLPARGGVENCAGRGWRPVYGLVRYFRMRGQAPAVSVRHGRGICRCSP